MNQPSALFFRYWRPTLVALSIGVIAYLLYFHNIMHLLPGFDAREVRVYNGASNWHTIVSNPVNAPYKVLLWLTVVLGHHGFIQARLAAASFGVLGVMLFYAITYRWYGFRTAFLATIMFATSAGFLHVARLGSAQIMQMGVLVYIAAILGYRKLNRHKLLASYGLFALLAILAYIPGMIWIELLGLILVRRDIARQFRNVATVHAYARPLVSLLLALPFLYAAAKTPTIINSMLGLPGQLSALKHISSNLATTLLSIGIRSNGDPEFFVGHAPLLNVIEVILFAIGAYCYGRVISSSRAIFLFASIGAAPILIALGGNVGQALLVPLLYLFIARGLHKLLRDWLGTFPRNPIAQYAGIGLVCVMLSFSVLYQIRSYFVAWPHSVPVNQEFSHLQP